MFFRNFKIESRLDARVKVVFSPKWFSIIKGPNDYNPLEVINRIFKVVSGCYDIVQVCPGHRPALHLPAVIARYLTGSRIVDEWWEWFGRDGLGAGKTGVRKLFSGLEDYLELRTKKSYDLILPITSTLKGRLAQKIQHRAVVLHGGMNSDHFVQYDKYEARRATGLEQGLIIVGMSNLCDGDHEDNLPFYKAFRQVSESHPRLRLLVSGNRCYIEGTVVPLIGEERLINIGWKSLEAFNRYLSSCDLFALPFPDTTRNRGRWPNKFTDYVWLKRPVITNKTGDLKEVVEMHDLGFCCKHSEAGYERALVEACEKANAKKMPIIDSGNCGLVTTQQRREEILKYYQKLRSGEFSRD